MGRSTMKSCLPNVTGTHSSYKCTRPSQDQASQHSRMDTRKVREALLPSSGWLLRKGNHLSLLLWLVVDCPFPSARPLRPMCTQVGVEKEEERGGEL